MQTNLITHPQPNLQAKLRLFCFPYAGGSSFSFRGWSDNLPETVELCPIELPGRGTQMKSAPLTQLQPLVETIASHLLPHLDRPFAFFGHSLGGTIAFETVRLLHRQYGFNPVYLFVSGCRAPQIPAKTAPIHDLPEPEFIEELRRLNGTPEAVFQNPELMEMLMPILRTDFAVMETYAYVPEPMLNCPIAAFGGWQDLEVSQGDLAPWQEQTLASFSLEMFPGDHFFLHTDRSALLTSISSKLIAAIARN
ncbi:MAG: thioesterase II family protein [Cyanosarcina radialis HA8281-LM2]|jgi:medium-chain acyl-[acyl-carrier-protein] hydrolase|nr:thioesterase II family protein [Cyanosarcina radialis HA8281-LM2]